MKKFICVLMFVLCATGLFAQGPDTLWTRRYGGGYWEDCNSAAQTSDGGYILGGWTDSFGAGSYDFWLVKTDSNGDSLWSRTFGGFTYDLCTSARQTSDGGFVMGGRTYSFGAGNSDFWLVKTDIDGNLLWSRTFGGSSGDECSSVVQTSDNGFILTGFTQSFGAGESDFWLVKTDGDGNLLWSRTFGGSSDDQCESVQQTSDGGFILGGRTESFGAGSADFWLVKTDEDGDSMWSNTFGGVSREGCNSVQQVADGGFILGGYTWSFGSGEDDFWLVKTDGYGDSLWSETFGGSIGDYCNSVQQTSDGGYILAGERYHVSSWDFFLVKADANGDSLWSGTFGGGGNDGCTFAQQTSDGGFILAGGTESFGAGHWDFWLVKTGPDLEAGPRMNLTPAHFVLDQNYPNPFNSHTRIAYELTKPGLVSLKIFDLLGREVQTLVNETRAAGRHEAVMDGSRLSSGVYLYQLQAENFVVVKKMVVLK